MTQEEIHAVVADVAGTLQNHLATVTTEHPQDGEGFPVIADPDLAQLVKAADEAVWRLSLLCFNIAREGWAPL